MKGVADRTLELMNEFQKEQYTKSYRDFQHFLVVKIEELEDEIEVLKRDLECTTAAADNYLELLGKSESENELRTGLCEWQYDEHHDVWETSCNNLWQFTNEGPKENDCQYCMYCGGVIDVLSQKEQDDE